MPKADHIPSPKLQPKKRERYGVPEPVRKSMLDVLMENFRAAKISTFVHRIIYAGEHFFPTEGKQLQKKFASIVKQVNQGYCVEGLTGFLLCYPKYFIHMVEGDEDSINKHLGLLLNDEASDKNFGKMKLLVQVSNVNRGTYVHRIMYAGEHFYLKQEDMLVDKLSNIVNKVNESYCVESLSGFLLCYTKYFIHMVEGDEDAINRHLGMLLNDKEDAHYFGKMKLLLCICNVNQRMIHKWNSYYGTPAQFLEKININSDLAEAGRFLYNCIKKMYNLIFLFVNDNCPDSGPREKPARTLEGGLDDDQPSLLRLTARSEMRSMALITSSSLSLRTPGQILVMDPYRATLPEYEVVDFAINTTHTMDLKYFYSLYCLIPQRDVYKDRIWPVAGDFVPYDVFDKPYDTIVELPKEKKEGEEEIDEEEEDDV